MANMANIQQHVHRSKAMTIQRAFLLLLPILVAESFYTSPVPGAASSTQLFIFGGGGGKIPASPAERCVYMSVNLSFAVQYGVQYGSKICSGNILFSRPVYFIDFALLREAC